MTRGRLLRRLLRARVRQVGALVALGAVGATAFTTLAVYRASTAGAIADGIRADHAGHAFTVQALDPSSAPVLTARSDLLPVWTGRGSVASATGQVPVSVRFVTSTRAVPGAMRAGRPPHAAGEAALSSAARSALGVAVGTTVEVVDQASGERTAVRITGETYHPAVRDEATVTVFAARGRDGPAVWLTDTDPFTDGQLRPLLDRRQISARTVAILAAEERTTALATLQAALRYAPAALAVLVVCLAGVLLAALRRERRRDVAALVAAGMPTGAAWWLLVRAAWIALTGGVLAGVGASLVVGYLARDTLSRPVNQDWQSISVPWAGALAFAALVPAACCLAGWLASRAPRRDDPAPAPAARMRWTGASLAAAGTLGWLLMLADVVPAEGAVAAGAAVTAGFAVCLAWVSATRAGPAVARLVAESARPLTGVAIVAGMVAFFAGYYGASQTHTSLVGEATSFPVQPSRSMLLDGLNAGTRAALQAEYRRLGGRATAYYLTPVETAHTIRATSPRMIECYEQRRPEDPGTLLPDCGPRRTMVPIATVGLTKDPAAADVVQADPALVEGGRVGVLDFAVPSSEITASTVLPARPTEGLGGNLPALVVGVDSPAARQLRLRPSGAESLVLLDFGSLPPRAQAAMRSAASRLAATALVNEDRGFDDGGRRAIATAVAIAGAGIGVLLLTAAGGSFLAAQRRLRRLLGHLGLGRRRRRALGIRMLLPALATQLVALAAA
ncbi:MAG TPA: FtsX-like permease family protein, partial [Pilimelia sp.]|nr:FtsX-like permease family protein [Pilimelia sp.]